MSELQAEGELAERLCLIPFGDGSTAVVVMPADRAKLSAMVLVDPGGPIVGIDQLVDVLIDIDAKMELQSIATFGIAPPDPEPLDQSCSTSEWQEIWGSCPVEALNARYVDDYAKAVEAVRFALLPDSRIGLIAASVAAVRWAQMIDRELAPPVDHAVFVSPLSPGLGEHELTEAVYVMAQSLFTAAVEDGCSTAECFGAVDLTESDCFERCQIVDDLSDLTDLSGTHIAAGLAGLSADIESNGPLVSELLDGGEKDDLIGVLEQGRASYIGADVLGGVHFNMVHLLAVACPAIAVGPDAEPPFSGCQGSDVLTLAEDGDRSSIFGSNVFQPRTTCYVFTQPDVILGLAANGGLHFGEASFSLLARTTSDMLTCP